MEVYAVIHLHTIIMGAIIFRNVITGIIMAIVAMEIDAIYIMIMGEAMVMEINMAIIRDMVIIN
jgi:hypothetical protein